MVQFELSVRVSSVVGIQIRSSHESRFSTTRVDVKNGSTPKYMLKS